MPLRLRMKPNERVIISGAVIRNGDHKTEFVIENKVPVLRDTDILSPGSVRTVCERIYMAIQLMYVDPEKASEHLQTYQQLAAEVKAAAPSLGTLLGTISSLVEAGELYKALKQAQVLLRDEKAIINNVVS
ncbi:MAG: flagellar protein FlbT [Candidatus Eisenbacteria bacterium]|uniref:Flagellar protein FlbT n=1 Tax=Eiseniibacteriota bacterium TaxID=2212470 RepID=A0A7Y2E7U5_UNCEI|nr:flagellar protein FlbT [Candidatus Eisenbacteria bacterium]